MPSSCRLQVMSVSLVSLGRMSFNWYLRKCTCTRIISLCYSQSRCSHRGKGGCLAAAAGFRSLVPGPGRSETSHEARSWRPRGLHLDHHRDQPTTLRPAGRLWHAIPCTLLLLRSFGLPDLSRLAAGFVGTKSPCFWCTDLYLFLLYGYVAGRYAEILRMLQLLCITVAVLACAAPFEGRLVLLSVSLDTGRRGRVYTSCRTDAL